MAEMLSFLPIASVSFSQIFSVPAARLKDLTLGTVPIHSLSSTLCFSPALTVVNSVAVE